MYLITDGFTETSPYVGIDENWLGGNSGPIGWETFGPMGLMWLYKYYGNVQVLQEAYNATKVSGCSTLRCHSALSSLASLAIFIIQTNPTV